MRLINGLILALVLVGKLLAQAQFPSTITLGAAPPTGVRAINASVTGPTGFANYYYWVIANFARGKADANSNTQISNAPNVLSGTNFVTVSWTPVAGAINYDVIKSTSNAFPASCNSCAIAIGVAGPTFNDVGGVGLFYTYSPVISNATASISLDNANYTIPRLLIGGPTNTTNFAGLPPASQYNGQVWVVNDASSPNTCTAGGGNNTPAFCYSNGTSWIPIGTGGGGGMVFPPVGIGVSTGTSWGPSKVPPTGTIIGDTDTQTMINKTVDGVTPATFAFLDPTSSVQTQLNGKQATLPIGSLDQYINGTLTLSTFVTCTSAGGVLQYSTTTHLWTCHTLVGTDLPNPAVGSKGGVQSLNCNPQFVQSVNTDGSITCATPAGTGNVTGPASSTTGDLASFADATGKVIQDSGVPQTSLARAATNVVTPFSTTPTFTCPSATGGTIVDFSLSTALTANITANVASCTNGSILNFSFSQDTTGQRTVTMPATFDAPIINEFPNVMTTCSYFLDGAGNGHLMGGGFLTGGNGCASNTSYSFGIQGGIPATPLALGQCLAWLDSTNFVPTWKCHNGTNMADATFVGVFPESRIPGQFVTGLTAGGALTNSAITTADLPATTTQTIGTPTIVVPTTSLAANSCDAAPTTATVTGANPATDTWNATATGDPTGTVGYGGGTNGGITMWLYITANTVNLKRCNQTGAALAPGALSLLVKVIR